MNSSIVENKKDLSYLFKRVSKQNINSFNSWKASTKNNTFYENDKPEKNDSHTVGFDKKSNIRMKILNNSIGKLFESIDAEAEAEAISEDEAKIIVADLSLNKDRDKSDSYRDTDNKNIDNVNTKSTNLSK